MFPKVIQLLPISGGRSYLLMFIKLGQPKEGLDITYLVQGVSKSRDVNQP